MIRLAWKGFLSWIQVNHAAEVDHLKETLRNISSLHDEVSQASLTELMDYASCAPILMLFQEYMFSHGNGYWLAAFNMSYLDMAEIMKGLLLSSSDK